MGQLRCITKSEARNCLELLLLECEIILCRTIVHNFYLICLKFPTNDVSCVHQQGTHFCNTFFFSKFILLSMI